MFVGSAQNVKVFLPFWGFLTNGICKFNRISLLDSNFYVFSSAPHLWRALLCSPESIAVKRLLLLSFFCSLYWKIDSLPLKPEKANFSLNFLVTILAFLASQLKNISLRSDEQKKFNLLWGEKWRKNPYSSKTFPTPARAARKTASERMKRDRRRESGWKF